MARASRRKISVFAAPQRELAFLRVENASGCREISAATLTRTLLP
jgi:hypothetical protein